MLSNFIVSKLNTETFCLQMKYLIIDVSTHSHTIQYQSKNDFHFHKLAAANSSLMHWGGKSMDNLSLKLNFRHCVVLFQPGLHECGEWNLIQDIWQLHGQQLHHTYHWNSSQQRLFSTAACQLLQQMIETIHLGYHVQCCLLAKHSDDESKVKNLRF